MPDRDIRTLLQDGVVLGDGGYLLELERRGYVDSGSGREKVGTGKGSGQYTPEVAIEHPEALRDVLAPVRPGGTLKEALAIQLEQSRKLNILADDRIRETLQLMARSPDERITDGVAREICQREGLKAVLDGSIVGLGSHYVLTLTAVNCGTGEALAREQREAASKEQVLATLGDAASNLRAKLGESLPSIQKASVPVENKVTTTSLEALRAYVEGMKLNS